MDESVVSVIHRAVAEWSSPRHVLENGEVSFFRFRCSATKLEAAVELAGVETAPTDVCEFMSTYASVTLFEDVDYGQWGLVLMGKDASARATAKWMATEKYAVVGDLVVGEFLGDGERLIIRAMPHGADFGHVYVSLPIDERAEWFHVANSFAEFVSSFVRFEGRKYWER